MMELSVNLHAGSPDNEITGDIKGKNGIWAGVCTGSSEKGGAAREGLVRGQDQERGTRASLVAQWLRVRLPMQGTRVRAPVWEDPTCRGAAGPVSHGC